MVLDSLAFRGDGYTFAFINDEPLDRAIGFPGMYGLDRDEWRITARTLQGWMPQELGLEREQYVPTGKPIAMRPGWQAVPVRKTVEVLLTLPGGDRPEVPADEVETLVSYDSVPMLGCSCGGGVGCSHESVTVAFERTRVLWTHGQTVFAFPRHAYNNAISDLLALLGESPRLISDEEWSEPMKTRLVLRG